MSICNKESKKLQYEILKFPFFESFWCNNQLKMLIVQYPQYKKDEMKYVIFFDKVFYLVFSNNEKLYNDFMHIFKETGNIYSSKMENPERKYFEIQYFNSRYLNEVSKNSKEVMSIALLYNESLCIPIHDDYTFAFTMVKITHSKDYLDYFEIIKDQLETSYNKYEDIIGEKYCNGYLNICKNMRNGW